MAKSPNLDLFTNQRSHWTEDFVQSLKPNTPTQLPEGRTGQALINYAKRTGKNIVVRKFEGSDWACMLSDSAKRGTPTHKTVKAPESSPVASESTVDAQAKAPSFPKPFDEE